MHTRKIFIEIVAVLFIILWVYAAMSKLLDFENFKLQLGKSPFITGMEGFVSWFIPLFELLIALLLISGRTRYYGLYMSFFLIFLFSGYIYGMLNFSYHLPCSCGGILSSMSWNQHLLFNIAFTILALIAIMLYPKQHTTLNKIFFARRTGISRNPV